MKLNKILLAVSAVFILSSCATKYRQEGFLSGGYTDFRVSSDKFVVSFRGNEYTSSDKTMKFALLRAAEITKKHGFKYFIVQDKEDISKSRLVKTTEEDDRDKSSRKEETKELNMPGLRLYIKCFHSEPKDLDVIEASQYISYNKPS
ncbi:MAG: hypothetical protein S4CHLAM37_15480 [Chlamydiia bacterium]|nr:hypothetical protein [Chlamydiia bacterium]